MKNEEIKEERQDLIDGRNAVTEALRAGRAIDKIYLAKGDTDKALGHIASTARAAGTVVVETDRHKLDLMSVTGAHQGVIAVCAVREYVSIDEILQIAQEREEPPFVIICDEISDPHNLGAIIRTAECAGAHGVIIPKRRTDLTGPIGLVIGSEGEGMSRLVAESCDFTVSIPLRGKVSSLNASAAAAVLMYEVLRQKSK